MKKNLLITFIFSIIPGAGQMYQEYMKRGLSIMILASIFLIIAMITGSIIFIVPLLVIMAYSFFDTYNIRNRSDEKRAEFIDEYIWNSDELGISITSSKISNHRKVIGYILITIGAYVFLDSVLLNLLMHIEIRWLNELCYMLSRYIPTIIASILAVTIGFKLISTKDKEN